MQAQDPDYQARTHSSFNRQAVMKTLDARLHIQKPGKVSIHFPYKADFTQQNGYVHAGIVATVLDSACGYAAYTLMPANADVLTVEFKVNLLRPARGDRFTATASVVKAGRTLTVAEAALHSPEYGDHKPVATMTATIMTVTRPDTAQEQA